MAKDRVTLVKLTTATSLGTTMNCLIVTCNYKVIPLRILSEMGIDIIKYLLGHVQNALEFVLNNWT